jgi:hypothetical protein
MNELQSYRNRQATLYNLKQKYSKLLDFDKISRSANRICNFIKKYVLFDVCNISDEQLHEINGIYRYRCYVYDIDICEIDNVNAIVNAQIESLSYDENNDLDVDLDIGLSDDSDTNKRKKIDIDDINRESYISLIFDERRMRMDNLTNSSTTIKYPVLLDLQLYGPNIDMGVYIGDKSCYLKEDTKLKIKKAYAKTSMESITGERFHQMIQYSKVLRDTYVNDISPKPKESKSTRTLQKAKLDDI